MRLKKDALIFLFVFNPRNDYSERATGIEPVTKAWEAFVLPLNYARRLTWHGKIILLGRILVKKK